MPLLDRTGWKDDPFVRFDEGFDAPAILVPATTLDAALAARGEGQRIGVELPNDFHAPDLLPAQAALDLVSIRFPAFTDGRGFGIARLLRQQGYAGPLRAAGPLIPDQFAFALRCGFDEVEISAEQAARQPLEQWLAAAAQYGASYQGPGSILARRRSAA